MSILLPLGLALIAAIASAVVIVRWALHRDRAPPGFPVQQAKPNPSRTDGPRP
jgi:hypothetical protein